MNNRRLVIFWACLGTLGAFSGCDESGMIVLMGDGETPKQEAECSGDERGCITERKPWICKDGKKIEQENCSEQGKCDNGECKSIQGCASEDAPVCEGNSVKQCVDGEWKIIDCANNICSKGKCVECEDGDSKCSGNDFNVCINQKWKKLYECNGDCVGDKIDDNTWMACQCSPELECSENQNKPCVVFETDISNDMRYLVSDDKICENGKICEDGMCVEKQSCNEESEVFFCQEDGRLYKKCIDNKWEYENCDQNQVCSREGCVMCKDDTCTELEKECHEESNCPDGYECNMRSCTLKETSVCKEEKRCNVENLNGIDRCIDGIWNLMTDNCADNQKCVDGNCVDKDVCDLNTSKCLNNKERQYCDAGGVKTEDCSKNTKVCFNGMCVECENGKTRCNPKNKHLFEVCVDNNWVKKEDCGDKLCVNEINDEKQIIKVCDCELGQTMCVYPDQESKKYRKCVGYRMIDDFNYDYTNIGGLEDECLDNGRCVDGQCREYCLPNNYRCVGNIYQECKLGGFISRVCASNEKCNAQNTSNPCECIDGKYKCGDDGERYRCNNKVWVKDSCGEGKICVSNTNGQCINKECKEKDKNVFKCEGGGRVRCNGKFWEDMLCGDGFICSNADGAACIKKHCDNGEHACVGELNKSICENNRFKFENKVNESEVIRCGMKNDKIELVNTSVCNGAEDGVSLCYKNSIVQCNKNDGKWKYINCSLEKCVYDNLNNVKCVSGCTCINHTYRCKGNTIEHCNGCNWELFADCDEVGLKCKDEGDNKFYCKQ